MKAMVNVRLGSSRLPGKVLMPLWNGKAPLQVLVERLGASDAVDEIIINTTTNPKDDKLIEFCETRGIRYNRGSEEDVLGRMCDCIRKYNMENFIEVFGDCPLIDPRVVDTVAGVFRDGDYDFVGNDLKTTFPPGFEVEIIKSSALLLSERLCKDASIREHGTLFIRQNPSLFSILNIEYSKKISDLPHLTLDTLEDFEVINHLHEALISKHGKLFSLENVLNFISGNLNVLETNKHIERRWKKYRNE
jgi:spore coat polysaccharide biosynthesis protein SpsF